MQYDWLIVGAGFTGSVLAERIATQLDQRVLVVERRSHIGGNAFDEENEQGVLVHRYGPHIFHTNAVTVWRYLSRFTAWREYEHTVLAEVGEELVPLPFNLNTLHQLFPGRPAAQLEKRLLACYGLDAQVPILRLMQQKHSGLNQLATFIYENIFLEYSRKQWDLRPEELSPSVTARVPVRVNRDNRYFADRFQAIPAAGYTALFRRLLGHPKIHVSLETDYRDVLDLVTFKRMIYTGPIDAFFDYVHGVLPYRSLRFESQTVEAAYGQPAPQINYPNRHAYTRITEPKRITGQRTGKTTLIREYPEPYVAGQNEPYYPIPKDAARVRCRLYEQEVQRLAPTVLFAGRLADYRYYNMDQAVARALRLFEREIILRT